MIDVTKPLEAVQKKTGQVVPLTFYKLYDRDPGSFHTRETPKDNESNDLWRADGSDYCSHDLWYVRNVADSAELAELRAFKEAALVRFPALERPETDDEAAARFADAINEEEYGEGVNDILLEAFAWARRNA